ncbi:hypothetical protein JZ751_008621 [Albula glossodonta]|uniref:Focadhesin C-terminal domain-containing protein n=1 Tax=Albula glossodonta TaxID=121402 RepID=A0A8T2P9X8_9TELE|nr:hypothetical protein JZ751_008621 [Albula glossodonta]
MYRSLSMWMKHVADDKLQTYLETLGTQPFGPESRPRRLPLCSAVLEGLAHAMALPNPSQNCWTILCSTAQKIFTLLPDQIQESGVELYVGIAKCLSEMTDAEIDRITQVTEVNLEKTGFILAYLSSQGRVPLLGLNDVIAMATGGGPRQEISWLLLQSFYQCRLATSPNTSVLKRMEWLLELMGHIRNVAYGTKPVARDTTQATDFLLQLFGAAVLSWADHSMPLLLGIRARWFPWEQGSETPSFPHGLYGDRSANEVPILQCLLGLPCSLQLLLTKEPWRGQTQKMHDRASTGHLSACILCPAVQKLHSPVQWTGEPNWLFSIADGPREGLSEKSIVTAKAALLSLKKFPEFKKKVVWTRTSSW